MIKRRILAAILWLAALTGLLGVWILSGSLLWLGILVTLFLLPLVSTLFLLPLRGRISCRLTLAPLCQKEQEAEGMVILKNTSHFSLRAAVDLGFENELTGERGEETLFGILPPKGKAELPFRVRSAYCGRVRVTSKSLSLLDLVGFWGIQVKGEESEAGTTFLPRMFPLGVNLSLSAVAADENETYAQDRSGYDFTELFQLREYVPGDNLHKIHWKLTAKTDDLIVREGSLPQQRSLLVFWDKCAPGSLMPETADALAESVASLCQKLSEEGYAYTLGWSEGDGPIFKEADHEDQLLGLLPELVSRSGKVRGEKEAVHREEGEKEYGTILLFAHALPENLDGLCQKSRVILLLCGEEAPEAPCRLITFTPKDYAERLQNLELTE